MQTAVIAPVNERSRAAMTRNAIAVAVVFVVAVVGLAVAAGHSTRNICGDSASALNSAEARYKALTGSYTDVAGLRYAGVLTEPVHHGVLLNGFPGSSNTYQLTSTKVC